MAETASDPEQLAAEAQAEAAEVKADIAETKEELAEAKEAGDTARVDRLEAALAAQDKKLDTVLAQLGKIADRPFHPAPEPAPDPAAPAAGTGPAPAEATEPAEAKPKKSGRKPSRAFFGARVDDDD